MVKGENKWLIGLCRSLEIGARDVLKSTWMGMFRIELVNRRVVEHLFTEGLKVASPGSANVVFCIGP
jgi:hypothetical protein